MSTFEPQQVPCPHCGQGAEHQVAVSINAARRPALREEIEAGGLHRFTCPACKAAFRLETTFTYIDFERRQLLMVFPPGEASRWAALEPLVDGLAERTLTGAEAPAAVHALAEGMRRRVCFGLDAFREKVLCGSYGIDDVALELVKLEIIRHDPLRLPAGESLRLSGRQGDELVLFGAGRPVLVATAALRAVAGDDYATARAAVAAGSFVDVNRLLLA